MTQPWCNSVALSESRSCQHCGAIGYIFDFWLDPNTALDVVHSRLGTRVSQLAALASNRSRQIYSSIGPTLIFSTEEQQFFMPKRTFQPNRRRRSKTHGFRTRMKTKSGQAVLSRRRAKGRKRVSVKPGFRG